MTSSVAAAGRAAAVAILIAGLLLPCGCAGPKKSGTSSSSSSPSSSQTKVAATSPASATGGKPFTGDITTTDPCANRLHDLAGSLLLYYAVKRKLPERAEELEQIGGPAGAGSLVCPVSNQPYVYNPKGVLSPDTKSRLILYDAAPSHAGRRWAISIVEPKAASDALVAKVVLVPDAAFPRSVP